VTTLTEQPDQQPASSIDVKYVAHLARMHLSDQEVATFQAQLDQVLVYVQALGELNLDHVEPTAHAVPVHNVFREDVVTSAADTHEAVMANAPQHRQGLFVVPRIIE
jgi:aspartyl-tRNA(Asn)/glutamyl-tRNA(Gln) amidotransferase subunit C